MGFNAFLGSGLYGSAAVSQVSQGSDPVVPEMVVYVQTENNIAFYLNPTQPLPTRLGTDSAWAGYKVDLTEYDEYQVRATFESGNNSGIGISVVCTSGSTPYNRVSTPFAVSSQGAGEAYEYMNLGQHASGTAEANFDGAATNDYVESAWTALDPSVKRECGLGFIYSSASGTTVGNRLFSSIAVAFRRTRDSATESSPSPL